MLHVYYAIARLYQDKPEVCAHRIFDSLAFMVNLTRGLGFYFKYLIWVGREFMMVVLGVIHKVGWIRCLIE